MTKKYSQTRRIIIFVLSLLFVASIGLCLMQNKGYANADEYQLTTSIELADRYFEGDVVKIPTAKFSNGTKEVEAEYTVKYPDGSERIATEVELATSGTYTIAYKALVDGRWLTENVTFDAVQKLFGVDNPTGSSEIQEYIFDDTATKKGLMTVIPAGSNFVYNKLGKLFPAPELKKGRGEKN